MRQVHPPHSLSPRTDPPAAHTDPPAACADTPAARAHTPTAPTGVKLLLLRRLCNSSAAEFRKAVISLTGLDKNESSLGIRTRLKVAQVKVAREDASVRFEPKVHLLLPERLLHEFLCILAEDVPDELSRLTVGQMQAVLRAYSGADTDVPASLLRDGAKKSALQGAIVAALRVRGADGGFARFTQLATILAQLKEWA